MPENNFFISLFLFLPIKIFCPLLSAFTQLPCYRIHKSCLRSVWRQSLSEQSRGSMKSAHLCESSDEQTSSSSSFFWSHRAWTLLASSFSLRLTLLVIWTVCHLTAISPPPQNSLLFLPCVHFLPLAAATLLFYF